MEDIQVQKIVTKFFIEEAQNKVYHEFMDDLHHKFNAMIESFKAFSKKEYDTRTAYLQKTMYGDPKDADTGLKWDFDQILPELVKMHAALQAAKLKEHTDLMLKVAEGNQNGQEGIQIDEENGKNGRQGNEGLEKAGQV